MDLREKLSPQEKDMIERYIKENMHISDDYLHTDFAGVDAVLNSWAKGKSNYLYKLLGENLILRKTVKYNRDASDIRSELYRMMWGEGAGYEFAENFNNWLIQYSYDHYTDVNYPTWHYPDRYDYQQCLYRLLETQDLYDNRYSYKDFEILLPDNKKMVVRTGAKLLKTLGKIASIFNIKGFEEFRLEHSRILNQKTLEGKLCLSIHPLDFMTMSDNNNDWDSCMSWMGDGCYRRGTVEMMNSCSVICAYLDSDKPFYPFSHDKENAWSNKKWRQLFIFNPDWGAVSVKAYPYENTFLTKTVLKWIRELDIQNYSTNKTYLEKVFELDSDNSLRVIDYPYGDFTCDFDTNIMYNDFTCTTHYITLYDNLSENHIWYNYSGPDSCMWCGCSAADYDDDDEASLLICNDCYHTDYCSCCDTTIYGESYELDGDILCEYCFNDNAKHCALTNELHHKNNMSQIMLVPGSRDNPPTDEELKNFYYYNSLSIYIDSSFVYPDKHLKSIWNECFKNDIDDLRKFRINWWDEIYMVLLDDLTDKGLTLFGESLYEIQKSFYNLEERLGMVERIKAIPFDSSSQSTSKTITTTTGPVITITPLQKSLDTLLKNTIEDLDLPF